MNDHAARSTRTWHPSGHALLLPIVLAAALAGCGSGEESETASGVDVSATADDGNVTFAWSGGDMHSGRVEECLEGCDRPCRQGVPDFRGAKQVWAIGEIPTDGSVPTTSFASPLTYGFVDGDEDPEARPLESGHVYSVSVLRWYACDEGPCAELAGCGVFTGP